MSRNENCDWRSIEKEVFETGMTVLKMSAENQRWEVFQEIFGSRQLNCRRSTGLWIEVLVETGFVESS